MIRIKALVKDCQPNDPKLGLDLYFPKEVADRFHWAHEQPIEIVLDAGAPWQGKVGIKPPNPPYLRRPLKRAGGKMSMRDWLLDQGVADGAEVELIQESPARFRWHKVMNTGNLLQGRATGDRRQMVRKSKPSKNSRTAKINTPLSGRQKFPLSDRSEVLRLAEEDYWALITMSEREKELTIERAMPGYRTKKFLDKSIFITLASWKSPRPLKWYKSNSEEHIRRATASVFRTDDDLEAINCLRELAGVGLRTATALLHWMLPHRFPILDYRVVNALGEQNPRTWDNVEYYSHIAEKIHSIAARLQVDLRTLDRALWAWDKKRSRNKY